MSRDEITALGRQLMELPEGENRDAAMRAFRLDPHAYCFHVANGRTCARRLREAPCGPECRFAPAVRPERR